MDADRLVRIKAYAASLPTDAPRVVLEELLTELAGLSDVAQIRERNQQLTWQVTDLAAEADRWRGQVTELRSALDGAQPSLAHASQQLIEYQARLMATEAERDQLRGIVQPVREENAHLAAKIEEANDQVADLQVRHNGLASHRDSLQRSLEDVTSDRSHWQTVASKNAQELDRALAREALLRADADRLARWIINNPTGREGERTEVLNLHDRVG